MRKLGDAVVAQFAIWRSLQQFNSFGDFAKALERHFGDGCKALEISEKADACDCTAEGREHDAEHRERLRQLGNKRRSEEHTSELQSLMRISYAVFCLKKKK